MEGDCPGCGESFESQASGSFWGGVVESDNGFVDYCAKCFFREDFKVNPPEVVEDFDEGDFVRAVCDRCGKEEVFKCDSQGPFRCGACMAKVRGTGHDPRITWHWGRSVDRDHA